MMVNIPGCGVGADNSRLTSDPDPRPRPASIATTFSCSTKAWCPRIIPPSSPLIWSTSAEESIGVSPNQARLGLSAGSWPGLNWGFPSPEISTRRSGTLKWTFSGAPSTRSTHKETGSISKHQDQYYEIIIGKLNFKDKLSQLLEVKVYLWSIP